MAGRIEFSIIEDTRLHFRRSGYARHGGQSPPYGESCVVMNDGPEFNFSVQEGLRLVRFRFMHSLRDSTYTTNRPTSSDMFE